MLRHIVTDLAEHYVNEVLKPKLGSPAGQSTAEGPGKGGPAAGGVNQGSDKRIRQAVYDIRYRARREEIPLQSAFTQYMAHTSMNAMEKKAVREKLGLDRPGGGGAPAAGGGGGEKPGAAAPQKEEVELTEAPLQKFKVRVTDKESGKTYVRMATREKIAKLRSNPFISSVEMTKYGKTYEGGEDEPGKAKKDYDGDGKVESGAKEYRGVIHNKIQQKKGGKPDGKDTSSVKEGMSTDVEDPNDLKKAVAKAVKRVDLNVSGDVDKKDKSMGNYGEFVPSADGKRKVVTKIAAVKEEFSNWREDLNSSEEDQNVDTIKEMPRGKKNKVKFNPEVAIENLVAEKGGEILEVKEVETINERGGARAARIMGDPPSDKTLDKKGRFDNLNNPGGQAARRAAIAAKEEVDLQEKGMSSDEMSSVLKGHKYTKRQLLDMSKKSTKQGRHGEADALYKEFQKEEAVDEAKVDKLLPDYKRSAARNARYDNPDGALALGGGIQRSRRAAHRERDEMNKDKKDVRRGKTGGPQFQGKTGAERLAKVKSELGEASYTPGNEKPFPYGKVGDKLRKLAGERDAEKDPKKRNKLASRLSKINTEYNLPEEFEKSDWRSELNPVDEKMNLATADMGDVIKDFYKSDAPQFKGKTKEEIRKMAIAAKLDAERGVDEKVNPLLKGILKKTPKGEDPKKGGVPYKITGRMTEKKELSVDDQMRISRDAAKDRNPNPDHQAIRGRQIRNSKAPKDTRTDAEKMADAYASPRKGPGGATRAD